MRQIHLNRASSLIFPWFFQQRTMANNHIKIAHYRSLGRSASLRAPYLVVKHKMHTIHYISSRQEVWRWYWRAWAKPKGLWLYHLVISVLCGWVLSGSSSFEGFNLTQFAQSTFIIFLVCMAIFPLWPQIMFKPQPRTLTINSTGIETTIGKKSGKRSWGEIKEIQDFEDEIVKGVKTTMLLSYQ